MQPLNVVAAAAGAAIRFVLTSGVIGGRTGFIRLQSQGSLVPDPKVAGELIEDFTSQSGVVYLFRLQTTGIADADSTFKQLEMTGTFSTGLSTEILLRTNAIYTADVGGSTEWNWTTDDSWRFVNNNAYDVAIT